MSVSRVKVIAIGTPKRHIWLSMTHSKRHQLPSTRKRLKGRFLYTKVVMPKNINKLVRVADHPPPTRPNAGKPNAPKISIQPSNAFKAMPKQATKSVHSGRSKAAKNERSTIYQR